MLVRRTTTAVAVGLIALLGFVRLTTSPDPGPVPTCNGETATHVLVKEGTEGDYLAWTAAGVIVSSHPDQKLQGTSDHDVLVSLVDTKSGGIIGAPDNNKRPEDGGPTTGDTMCGLATDGKNLYYGTRFPDTIIDADGDSDIYAGGCKYLGKGGAGTEDDFCDLVRGNGGTDKT